MKKFLRTALKAIILSPIVFGMWVNDLFQKKNK